MASEPNSYGTGRDPRQGGSCLIPVLFLVLSCIMVHGLTLLYLSRENRPSQDKEQKLSFDDLPSEAYDATLPIRDNCGLGLEFSDISEIQQRYWSLPDGVFVEQIETDSTAYRAGLRSGDLLVQIEDQEISDTGDCLEVLEACREEDSLDLIYYRDGEERSLRIPMSQTEEE